MTKYSGKYYPYGKPAFPVYPGHKYTAPRSRFKSKSWRQSAYKFLKRANEKLTLANKHVADFNWQKPWKGRGMLRNALRNFRNTSYKVGWTAKTAVGKAHALQKRWRKRHFDRTGNVI